MIIRFQKTNSCAENDDTLVAYNNHDGTIDVVMKVFTNPGNDAYYTLSIHEFYRYITKLFSIFKMDTKSDDGTDMHCIQVDITGFPTFLLGKRNFNKHINRLSSLIEYWAESA
jgi:hypothetical protein